MRVFRRRHTLGCLALLAIATQAALAFAHTHVHTRSTRDSLAARAITFGLCRQSDERPCPRPPSVPHDDHAQCSICVAVSHAGAAVLDAAPGIPLRHLEGDAPVPHRTAAQVDGTATVRFQARAPPCA